MALAEKVIPAQAGSPCESHEYDGFSPARDDISGTKLFEAQ